MTRYSADRVLAELKDFQRASVDHVIERFFGDHDQTRRFLIADETGLGKSVVARGIIARTLEKLQDDDEVDRIDVVYVCSNADIASQNLARLRVTEDEHITLSSRLTMLAKHSQKLAAATAKAGKPLNLIAFTPGTSFDSGWRTGKVEERAMLHLLLEERLALTGWRNRASLVALRATARTSESFEWTVRNLRQSLDGPPDRTIAAEFGAEAERLGLLSRFDELLDEVGRRRSLPTPLRQRAARLIGDLRAALAKAGVHTLQPDLVILDEFQRFRHLLSVEKGGEAAELAHHLFNYPQARVLLLSATPYKPFTFAQESESGDDHHQDFLETLRFLRNDATWTAETRSAFAEYRDAMVRGERTDAARDALRELLLKVMVRTERPPLGQDGMLAEVRRTASDLSASDLRGYVALRSLATEVNAPVTLEYWKSAPYFVNFTEGYQLGHKLRAALMDGSAERLKPLLKTAQLLDVEALGRFDEIDLGNGRLRELAASTVEEGWWRLLWVPPSMPHYQLSGHFSEAAAQGMTKRLVFSSWSATPTSVAGLLSYEAERQIMQGYLMENTAEARRRVASRLDYRLDNRRPAAMSTLALFWPHPTLARLADPLGVARTAPDQLMPVSHIEESVRERLADVVPAEFSSSAHAGEVQPWSGVFRWPGAVPDPNLESVVAALTGHAPEGQTDATETGLELHVSQAFEVAAADAWPVATSPEQVLDDIVALALHGPGNIAWRALGRLVPPGGRVSAAGHWRAAATLAGGLRSLFNRPESTFLLDRLVPDVVYWRAVLRYCAAGGLQAVLDEYLHHLRSSAGMAELDDPALMDLAQQARDALSIRPSTYRAFNPLRPEQPIPLTSRFALRYGGRRDDADGARQPEIRGAFNSPFWPFVLATTSAGQEGIDFHWWCSAIVHWNTPANPVDFEQREGRVHRFGGHTIRRNVAERHRAEALRSPESDVWKAAYEAARAASNELGDFAPYWVYPGSSKVERHLFPYPLSRDTAKADRLKEELVLYRLAFGQPRQEDMLELLRQRGVAASQVRSTSIDLRPPPVAPMNQ